MPESFAPPQGPPQELAPPIEHHIESMKGTLETASYKAGFSSEIGKNKELNEDRTYAFHNEKTGESYFGIFDGMGGHDAGDKAADAAQGALHIIAHESLKYPHGIQNMQTHFNHIFGGMQRAVETTAKELGNESIGTTGLVAILKETSDGIKQLTVGAVADSLAFLVRKDGTVLQLNKEETVRQRLIDEGQSASYADKFGNQVTNALMPNEYKGVSELSTVEVIDGDVIVLTSDGITGDTDAQRLRGGTSNEDVIRQVSLDRSLTPKQRAEKLIALSGKQADDKTAIVIEVGTNNNEQQNSNRDTEKAEDLESALGLNSEYFRVTLPDGTVVDKRSKIIKRGAARDSKGDVTDAVLLHTKHPETGEIIEHIMPVDKLLAGEKERREEHMAKIAKAYEAKEAQKAASLAQQEAMGMQARQEIQAIHDTSESSVDIVTANGFTKGQEVLIKRSNGDYMRGAVISGQRISKSTGEMLIMVQWDGVDRKTGKFGPMEKSFTPAELKQFQKDFTDGKVKRTVGPGIEVK